MEVFRPWDLCMVRIVGRPVVLGYVLTVVFVASSCMKLRSTVPEAVPPRVETPPMEVDPTLLLRTPPGHRSAEALPKIEIDRCGYLGEFSPSFYQIVDERDFEDTGRRRRVRDRQGHSRARVRVEFHRRLNIEGCGKLADGRVITYDTRINGEIRFRVTTAPHGLSHCERPLVPFRTAAVDPDHVALGTILFVPAARGARLPDSSYHDGLFVADDVGSAIRDDRVDIFVGFEDHINNSLTLQGRMRHFTPVAVYEVPDEVAIQIAATAVP